MSQIATKTADVDLAGGSGPPRAVERCGEKGRGEGKARAYTSPFPAPRLRRPARAPRREAHVPAEEAQARPHARVPRPHAHARRAARAPAATGEGPHAPHGLDDFQERAP